MFGYPYPPPSPREFIKAMREWEEWEEVKNEKKKKGEQKKKDPRGLSGMEVFLFLTLISPVVGPLYLYAVIAAAHKITDMLATVH